jgi:hypothetical protein
MVELEAKPFACMSAIVPAGPEFGVINPLGAPAAKAFLTFWLERNGVTTDKANKTRITYASSCLGTEIISLMGMII